MAAFGKRSLLNLDGVHPDLVKVLETAILNTPVDFSIDFGVRSTATQQRLYALGRTTKNPDGYDPIKKPLGDIVTKADGVKNKSNHQRKSDGYGHAVDVYPFVNGAIDFGDVHGKMNTVAAHILGTAKKLGIKITWGGSWTVEKQGIVDRPHFQI